MSKRPERLRYRAVLASLAMAALGVAAVVYGGFDDSPGLQLIGVLIIVGAVVLGVKSVRIGRAAGESRRS